MPDKGRLIKRTNETHLIDNHKRPANSLFRPHYAHPDLSACRVSNAWREKMLNSLLVEDHSLGYEMVRKKDHRGLWLGDWYVYLR